MLRPATRAGVGDAFTNEGEATGQFRRSSSPRRGRTETLSHGRGFRTGQFRRSSSPRRGRIETRSHGQGFDTPLRGYSTRESLQKIGHVEIGVVVV